MTEMNHFLRTCPIRRGQLEWLSGQTGLDLELDLALDAFNCELRPISSASPYRQCHYQGVWKAGEVFFSAWLCGKEVRPRIRQGGHGNPDIF